MSLSSGLPEILENEEDLARFLTSSNHFNSIGPKPAAFMPNPRNDETSVYRHGGTPIEELRKIAQAEVGHLRIHGAAIVGVKDVRDAFLEVLAKEPPLRHADIVHWPKSDTSLDKAKCKELCLLINRSSKKIDLDLI